MRLPLESLADTIVAPATPPGRSALALLRVSGPRAHAVLAAVAPALAQPLDPRRPALVTFVDETGESLDRGLATFFPGPGSATGEDLAELSVHGSPVVVQRLLESLVAAGARLARAGEFTMRAVIAGKMDLVEAEAVGELIDARTPAAARASAARLEGHLSETLAVIRERLVTAAAHLAAAVDFSEDVGPEASAGALPALTEAQEELSSLADTYQTGRLLSCGARVALLGPPNAGKSTLFNALAGSARAIVTEIPGTTRDTLEAEIDVGGIPVTLVDTAGLRATDDLVEREGVARAREAAKTADAILYVFDASAGSAGEDPSQLDELSDRPLVLIANKIDRVAEGVLPAGIAMCGISADAGERLRGVLFETLAARVSSDGSGPMLGSLRQHTLVVCARDAAAQGIESQRRGESPEYAAVHVHGAIDALSDLVGETTSEDVLNRIFSTFCIGK